MKNKVFVIFAVVLAILITLPLPEIVLTIFYLVLITGLVTVLIMAIVSVNRNALLKIYLPLVSGWSLYSIGVIVAAGKKILNDENLRVVDKMREYFTSIIIDSNVIKLLRIVLMLVIVVCLVLFIQKKTSNNEKNIMANDTLKILKGAAEAEFYICLSVTASYFAIHYGNFHEELIKAATGSFSIAESFTFLFLSLMLINVIIFRWTIEKINRN